MGIKPAQRERLGRKFGEWLVKKYGSLDEARKAWDGVGKEGDDFAQGKVGLLGHLADDSAANRGHGETHRRRDRVLCGNPARILCGHGHLLSRYARLPSTDQCLQLEDRRLDQARGHRALDLHRRGRHRGQPLLQRRGAHRRHERLADRPGGPLLAAVGPAQPARAAAQSQAGRRSSDDCHGEHVGQSAGLPVRGSVPGRGLPVIDGPGRVHMVHGGSAGVCPGSDR